MKEDSEGKYIPLSLKSFKKFKDVSVKDTFSSGQGYSHFLYEEICTGEASGLVPSHACSINHEMLHPPQRHDPAPNKRPAADSMEVHRIIQTFT